MYQVVFSKQRFGEIVMPHQQQPNLSALLEFILNQKSLKPLSRPPVLNYSHL